LEREEALLAREQESLRNGVGPSISPPFRPFEDPTSGVRIGGWWRAATKRSFIWWLKIRRGVLAEEGRRLALLEGDIEFAMRQRRRRSH
jgi:hypothetical protein